jgi:quercetin dioxygenase-like cupin family protein
MKTSKVVLGGLLAFAAAGAVCAEDAVQASPDTHKVTLENEHVRVVDIRVPAGGRVKMHTHREGYLTVAFTDCRIRFGFPGGKTTEAVVHAGDVSWSGPLTHSGENLGASECHLLNVEPKAPHAHKKN